MRWGLEVVDAAVAPPARTGCRSPPRSRPNWSLDCSSMRMKDEGRIVEDELLPAVGQLSDLATVGHRPMIARPRRAVRTSRRRPRDPCPGRRGASAADRSPEPRRARAARPAGRSARPARRRWTGSRPATLRRDRRPRPPTTGGPVPCGSGRRGPHRSTADALVRDAGARPLPPTNQLLQHERPGPARRVEQDRLLHVAPAHADDQVGSLSPSAAVRAGSGGRGGRSRRGPSPRAPRRGPRRHPGPRRRRSRPTPPPTGSVRCSVCRGEEGGGHR